MIEVLLGWAERHETLEIVALGVFHTNAGAIRLYQSMGFVHEGAQRDFFRIEHANGPIEYVDDLIMTKRVKPRPGLARARD